MDIEIYLIISLVALWLIWAVIYLRKTEGFNGTYQAYKGSFFDVYWGNLDNSKWVNVSRWRYYKLKRFQYLVRIKEKKKENYSTSELNIMELNNMTIQEVKKELGLSPHFNSNDTKPQQDENSNKTKS